MNQQSPSMDELVEEEERQEPTARFIGSGRRRRNRSSAPKSPKPVDLLSFADIEAKLAQTFAVMGVAIGIRNQADGSIVLSNAENLAKAYTNLARENASVHRALSMLAKSSVYGEAMVATAQVVIPIMMNHGALNPFFEQFFEAPADEPEEVENPAEAERAEEGLQ